MHLRSRLPFGLALLVLVASSGCLYIPPLSNDSGRKDLVVIKAGMATRQSLEAKLGKPDVVDLPSVQVWSWRQNRGTILIPPAEVNLLGEHFRLLARYEGDQVVSLETEHEPPFKPILRYPPLPAPTDHFLLEPAPQTDAVRNYRAWVGPEGTWYVCGWAGDLWLRKPGEAEAKQVAVLNGFDGKGSRNDTRASFAPEGRILAIAREEWITLWDAQAGKLVDRLPALDPDPAPGKGAVHSDAQFSPDGSRLAIGALRTSAWKWTGKVGGGLRVLDVATWKPLWEPQDIDAKGLEYSPDGTRLQVAGTLFDAATGRRLSQLPPASVRFLPGGRHLTMGDELLLQDTASGQVLARVPLRSGPRKESAGDLGWNAFDVRMLADGTLLAVGNGVLLRCDFGPMLQDRPGPAPTVQPTVRLLPLRQRYDLRPMEPKWELEPRFVWQLSPGGDFILEQAMVFRYVGVHSYWGLKALRILDTRTLQTLWEEWPPKEALGGTRFLEDGRLLQTAGGEVRIWKLPTQP
jgi:hypothetical protein